MGTGYQGWRSTIWQETNGLEPIFSLCSEDCFDSGCCVRVQHLTKRCSRVGYSAEILTVCKLYPEDFMKSSAEFDDNVGNHVLLALLVLKPCLSDTFHIQYSISELCTRVRLPLCSMGASRGLAYYWVWFPDDVIHFFADATLEKRFNYV